MPDVLTIQGALARARSEGLPVSEYALRGWVKAGVIPARMVGRKALLYWPNLRNFLICSNGTGDVPLHTEEPGTYGAIRRLG